MSNFVDDESYCEPVYAIGHAAKKLGVAAPTIRMYEREGLLLTFRTETNRRVCSKRDFRYLEQIIHLIRRQGLNIDASCRLAAKISCPPLMSYSEAICRQRFAYLHSSKVCQMISNTMCARSTNNCRTRNVYLLPPHFLQYPKIFCKNTFE